jgi:cadherin 5 type 2 (VE-cadherin)
MYQHARPDPISIHQFAVEVEQKHHNSNLKFAEEFETLKHSSPSYASTTAEEQHNRINNRYTNILPFEHSRVKLQPVDGSTDYINASYMTDKNGVRDFIAAQGPMQATIDHFWRMIWEQNVSYIVMVTSLFDKNREKCAKYWPDPVGHTVTYGDIDVHLLSEKDVKSFYVIRTFDVTYCKERRRVIQFFCDNIPDYGVPEDIDAFLDFIQEVRNIAGPKLTPPIVVHCSAGVGRTGTFIAIERLLRYMKHTNTIDIFGLILQMREHRAYMVQTEIQYVCIHDCIKRAVERGWHRAQYAPAVDEPIYVNNVSATAAAAAADATYANLGYQPDNPQPVSAADIELITFGVPKVIDH